MLNFLVFKKKTKFLKLEENYNFLYVRYHFVNLNELVFNMYTVLGLEIVFHKIIEKIWKNFVPK